MWLMIIVMLKNGWKYTAAIFTTLTILEALILYFSSIEVLAQDSSNHSPSSSRENIEQEVIQEVIQRGTPIGIPGQVRDALNNRKPPVMCRIPVMQNAMIWKCPKKNERKNKKTQPNRQQRISQ